MTQNARPLHFDRTERLLIFGGPYSNLAATRAMQTVAHELSIPARCTICTGDVIAYGAEPQETAQLVKDWGIHVVAGNCEEQIAAGAMDCGCGFEEGSVCEVLSRGWYPFALANTSDDIRRWMAGLPPSLDFEFAGQRCRVIHGGRDANNRFIFASDRELIAEEAAAMNVDIVFAGHAGIPFIAQSDRGAWVNAGVIGVPANDGTADTWYAIVEAETSSPAVTVRLHRLTYDYRQAAAAMRRAGHANGYARALVTGIWPSHDVLPPAELNAAGVPLHFDPVRIEARAAVPAA